MTLAEVDRLNILYFGDMQLSAKEKALRVRIATEFEAIVRKYLLALQAILASAKSEQEKNAMIAVTATAFSREYRRFFNQWYYKYYDTVSDNTQPDGSEAEWRNTHSTMLSAWLANTTRKTPSGSIMSRLRSDIRTEVNVMCNLAIFRALADGGEKLKTWKAHRDELTRPTHAEADGQTVPINEPFVVGGYRMMFPGDTSLGAPAQEIVRCRCIITRSRQN